MMRHVAMFLIFLTVACSEGDPELDQILKRQAEAMGSLPEGTMLTIEGSIFEPGWDQPLTLRFDTMKPGMVRVTAGSGDGTFQEGYDGSQAWERLGLSSRASGVEDLAEAALRHSAEWMGGARSLLELRNQRGARIEMIPEDEQFPADKGLIALRVTLADDFQEDIFLDPETYLIIKKRTSKSLHVWLATQNIDLEASEE